MNGREELSKTSSASLSICKWLHGSPLIEIHYCFCLLFAVWLQHCSILLYNTIYPLLCNEVVHSAFVSILTGGWWISWSPFVGMFIARISRGRTIKDFIMYTLTLPSLYSFFWMTIFGGVAIQMENDAINSNLTCAMYALPVNDTSMYVSCRYCFYCNGYSLS